MIQTKIPLGRGAPRQIFLGTRHRSKLRGVALRRRVHHVSYKPQPAAMSLSADALYKMSDVELLAAYIEARRQFVEKKFARDTHRARLGWIRTKMLHRRSAS